VDSDRYVAYVPVLPGCTTFGDTPDDALGRAGDAVSLMLKDLAERQADIPTEPEGTLTASIVVEAPTPTVAVA
jgi:predicted RNase H-like HicB family nuclease